MTFGHDAARTVHALVKESGAPATSRVVLCGLAIEDIIEHHAEWGVLREKTIGVPANPFFSERQCGRCGDLLAI